MFLAPASSSPLHGQDITLLVYGAVTAQPVENRLARPISNPPSKSAGLSGQVESGHPSLPSSLGKSAGEPVDSYTSCPVPLIE
mgnify:CR=1 FL=1|jgi:hypothetical protein